jgi:membrane dipeptidase
VIIRRTIGALILILLTAGIVFFTSAADWFDARNNTVVATAPYNVSPAAKALHAKLRIADMHSDQLLWTRDLLKKSDVGSTDLPRLIDGNVAIQIFSTVSRIPRELNNDKNSSTSFDLLDLLALGQRRPRDNWTSPLARAVYTSRKLHDAAERAGSKLIIVTNAGELTRALEMRAANPTTVIALLSLEGMQVLEGKPENLKTLYSLGFRMAGLAHFFDNEVAGSAHGEEKGGLTPMGRDLVTKMEEKGIIIDVAHASAKTVDDVLKIATRPIVVSHGGVFAQCPSPRTLTDDQLRRIGANGGVVGIGFWPVAVCDSTAKGVAKAIAHAVKIAGVEHVGLGSDWDGDVREAFGADGIVLLTDALLKEGLSEDDIAKVMGENVIRLLLQGLPAGPGEKGAAPDSAATNAVTTTPAAPSGPPAASTVRPRSP